MYCLAYSPHEKHNIQNIAAVKSVHFPLPLTKEFVEKILNPHNLHKTYKAVHTFQSVTVCLMHSSELTENRFMLMHFLSNIAI